MKKLAAKLVCVLCLFVSSPAMSAGNFEFVIAAETGLKLSITGYSADGAVMFEAKTVKEERDGDTVYVARIDEKIVFGARLVRWCVSDRSGKWDALEAHPDAAALCDDAPSETKGSYVFSPDSVLAKASQADKVAKSSADPKAALCIQRVLNDMGYNAGREDGALGKKTMNAAAKFEEKNDHLSLPELDSGTVGEWCSGMMAAMNNGQVQRADR